MLELWKVYMNSGVTLHLQIQAFLELNVSVAQMLDTYSPKTQHLAVPAEQAKILFANGLTMAQLHLQISEHCTNNSIKAFNITSKTHFALHSLQFSSYIHPYCVWCFKGESQMRVMSTIWKSCLSGAKQWAVCNRAAAKFRHKLHILFEKIKQDA